MRADGEDRTTIIDDPKSWISSAVSCDGGRWLAIGWRFRGPDNSAIWRLKPDGSNSLKIAVGSSETRWVCSPDGKWIYFYDHTEGSPLMRVSTDGGTPETVEGTILPKALINAFAISPDGKTIVAVVDQVGATADDFTMKFALVDLTGAFKDRVRIVDLAPGRAISFFDRLVPQTTTGFISPRTAKPSFSLLKS